MAGRFSFPARFKPAAQLAPRDRGFVVTFPDLPEAITQGENAEDAMTQAIDCLDEALAARIVNGEAIPHPSKTRRGQRLVVPSAIVSAKAALHLALRNAKLSKMDLARRLGCDEKDVRRLLDPRHNSRLPAIEAALAALGQRLIIEARAAA